MHHILVLAQSITSPQGTAAYMAPEQHLPHAQGITPASDIWAFAVTLLHMLLGSLPYKGLHEPQIINRVANQGRGPDLPQALLKDCPGLQQLLQECLSANPTARPTAAAALQRLQDTIAAQVRLLVQSCFRPAQPSALALAPSLDTMHAIAAAADARMSLADGPMPDGADTARGC